MKKKKTVRKSKIKIKTSASNASKTPVRANFKNMIYLCVTHFYINMK